MDGSKTRQKADTNDAVMLVAEGKEIMMNDDIQLETASMEAAREAGLAGKKGQPGPPPPAEVKIASRWVLEKKIGSGAFGDIYVGNAIAYKSFWCYREEHNYWGKGSSQD